MRAVNSLYIKRAGFQRLGDVMVERFNETIRLAIRNGLLEEDTQGIRLTRRGLLLADGVTAEFCP